MIERPDEHAREEGPSRREFLKFVLAGIGGVSLSTRAAAADATGHESSRSADGYGILHPDGIERYARQIAEIDQELAPLRAHFTMWKQILDTTEDEDRQEGIRVILRNIRDRGKELENRRQCLIRWMEVGGAIGV